MTHACLEGDRANADGENGVAGLVVSSGADVSGQWRLFPISASTPAAASGYVRRATIDSCSQWF